MSPTASCTRRPTCRWPSVWSRCSAIDRGARALPAGRGGRRGELRQQERRLDPEAWRCARRRPAGPGRVRPAGHGIFRQPDQEIGGRRRPRREGAGAADGAPTAPRLRDREAGRRRRAGGRDLPRASRRHAQGVERGAMIAKLSGIVDWVGPEGAVIDVGGVGYLAFCSTRTLGQLPPAGGAVRLFVETHVREDHIHLYGFIDAAERDWFRLLTTVQGVGARLALAILSAIAPE